MHSLIVAGLAQVAGIVGAQHAAPLPSPHAAPLPPTTCYEIFVRSFYDSNGDGIGDLRGLTQKLDYIAGLGVDCVWLMPVAESPSYHGYDVTNYYKIEPDYGTNDDFRAFVTAAHQRHVRVLVDLVLNHVSSEHPFFQEALRDSTAPHRAWFRWSKTRGNNWHHSPVRDEYYYGLFWSGMPDLNYENPAVLEEMKHVARFWLDSMHADGFRLDAVRHLIEVGEQNSNTPGTHAVLRQFGQYVRSVAPQSYTIGEVWDNTDVILTYYPDQLDAYFAFPISEALMDAVRTGKTGALLPTVAQFQRAQLIYYGEEIGMTGDKPDERLRTPMQWSGTSAGFTSGRPWETAQADSLTVNVVAEDHAPNSLLSLYRQLIHQRASNPALRDGELIPVETGSESVLAYIRKAGSRTVLVVANLGTTPSAPFALPDRTKSPSLPPRQAHIYELRQ